MIAFDDLRKILLLENVSDSMLGKMVPLLEMRVYSERDIGPASPFRLYFQRRLRRTHRGYCHSRQAVCPAHG